MKTTITATLLLFDLYEYERRILTASAWSTGNSPLYVYVAETVIC
jgi:hypothetical protein